MNAADSRLVTQVTQSDAISETSRVESRLRKTFGIRVTKRHLRHPQLVETFSHAATSATDRARRREPGSAFASVQRGCNDAKPRRGESTGNVRDVFDDESPRKTSGRGRVPSPCGGRHA